MGDYSERASLVERRENENCCKRGCMYLLECECCAIIGRGCIRSCKRACPPKAKKTRTVVLGGLDDDKKMYPRNKIRNQKYSVLSFIPLVLFHEFKFFLNLYYLLIALSQFVPPLKVNYLFTYWAPLCFVQLIRMLAEGTDDVKRWSRDKEINRANYTKVTTTHEVQVMCQDINVGDIILVNKGERVPADMILLRTSEPSGTCFIKTDQLDGETDWKLRVAVPATQSLATNQDLLSQIGYVYCDKPHLDINSFIGTMSMQTMKGKLETPLNVEHTLWKDTVIATGTAVGVVIYTGADTRSVMNTSKPRIKVGIVDLEINFLTKLLGIFLVFLVLLLIILQGFQGAWGVLMIRFLILLSAIIPISLRVNLDVAKLVYCWFIQRDKTIPGTMVRNTTISEELGRISFLMADKTGTLTQNDMIFKKLHLGNISFSSDTRQDIKNELEQALEEGNAASARATRLLDAVIGVALCHNVTPGRDPDADLDADTSSDVSRSVVRSDQSTDDSSSTPYQASSPDEVALIKWISSVGLTLVFRDLDRIHLRSSKGQLFKFRILEIFPFSSEAKRMGIIVQNEDTRSITFYVKGADTVISGMCDYTDWLDEECGNMAREGLRTLVYASKPMSQSEYDDFATRLKLAKLSMTDRPTKVRAVIEGLETGMSVLSLTGVEDRLQMDVRPTLESIRYAGVKVWMLTGDKLETALCIAKSSRLISPSQSVHVVAGVGDRMQAHHEMNSFRKKGDCALVILGDSLSLILKHYEHEFMALIIQCPAVVVCRCTPTQKAMVVRLIQKHTHKRCAAIGDGGNDVNMIQMANAGIGIVGKEGKQAALAADFSIVQFRHIGRLFLVHGRNSYKRSAALAQFVMHRGMIISMMQAIFCACFYFAAVSLYNGFLIVGYATFFTVLPVFSLVVDKDVKPEVAMMYPELYKELLKGRYLTVKTFLIWILIAIYQASVLMFGALLLFDTKFLHIVPISFTGLILTELIMVCLTVETWIWMHAVAIIFSLVCYGVTVFVDTATFTRDFLLSWEFVWKVVLITAVSCLPIYIMKLLRKKFSPATYSKLN